MKLAPFVVDASPRGFSIRLPLWLIIVGALLLRAACPSTAPRAAERAEFRAATAPPPENDALNARLAADRGPIRLPSPKSSGTQQTRS